MMQCVQLMGADTKVAGAEAVADYGSAKAAASSLLTSRQGYVRSVPLQAHPIQYGILMVLGLPERYAINLL